MENKFLKYIENKDDNLSSELSLPEKSQAESLLKLMKSSIPPLESHNCNHDLEDICAYVEKETLNTQNKNLSQSDTMKLIKEQIFDCDSCFDTYSFLKNAAPEISNLTPKHVKEKVYQKNNDLNFKKKSIWYIIKNNKALKYSSGAVAAMFLLFFSISPLNTDMSDFHKSKESSQIVESPQKEQSKDQDNLLKRDNGLIQKSMPKAPAKIENYSNNIPEPSINPQKPKSVLGNSNTKREAKKIVLEKPVIRQRAEISLKNKLAVSVDKNFSEPKLQTPLNNHSDEILKKENVGQINKDLEKIALPQPVVSEPEKEKILVDENQESKKNMPLEENLAEKPAIPGRSMVNNKLKDKEQDKSFSDDSPKSEATNKIMTNNEAKPNPPAPDKANESSSYTDIQQSPIDTKSGVVNNNISRRKTATLKQNKTVRNDTEEIILNFKIEKKGFIIAKDIENKIIGQSNLLSPDDYKNFNLIIEKNSKKFFVYIYSDENNNGYFDKNDLLEKSL